MADSKALTDGGQYLLNHGMKQHLLGHGILVTVHEIRDSLVRVKLDDHKVVTIHLDIALPSTAMELLRSRWMKALMGAQLVSAPIRMLGLQRINDEAFRATEETVMLKQCGIVNSSELRLVECYAGGVGGWSRAAGFMSQLKPETPLQVVGAVEKDPDIAKSWNSNHATRHNCICIVGDLTDEGVWMDMCHESEPNALSISSPCRSFSRAGSQNGWNSQDAFCLASSLWFSHLAGVQLLTVENVEALRECQHHWEGFLSMIDFCGYRIAAEKCVNANILHPICRARAIIVLVAKSIPIPNHPSVQWPSFLDQPECVSLWSSGRWVDPPQEHMFELQLDEPVLQEYLKRDRMPPKMRHDMMVGSPEEARHVRCIRSQFPIPSGTMLAQYGNQHNMQGQILGSLRRMNRTDCRLLHPLELVIASGVAAPCILPQNRRLAYTMVGNMITEMHGLLGLSMAVNVVHEILECSPIDVKHLLQFHAKLCISKDTVQWLIGDVSEGIMYVRGTMDNESIPRMSCTPLDDDPLSQFAAEYQTGRICQVRELEGQTVQTPASVRIPFDAKPDHIMDATRKLLPTWEPFEVFGDHGNQLNGARCFNDEILTIAGHDTAAIFDLQGVVVGWAEFLCKLPILPHECFHEWSINGTPVTAFKWYDADGLPWDLGSPMMYNGKLFTDGNVPWPNMMTEGHVLVVRIANKTINSQFIKFSLHQTIEDLMAAEQMLMGPSDRISSTCNHTTGSVDPNALLQDTPIVVFSIVPAHKKINVMIQQANVITEKWVERGTRLFEVHQRKPHEIPVESGRELAWDMPILHTMRVQILQDPDEEEISPTIPFTVIDDPAHDSLMAQRFDTSIQQLINNTTIKVQHAMQQTLTSGHTFPFPEATRQRASILMQYGPAVGNDEMSIHLIALASTEKANIIGMKSWSDDFLLWEDFDWPVPQQPRDDMKNILMLLCDKHWIPVIVYVETRRVEYRNMADLTNIQTLAITSMFEHGETLDMIRFDSKDGLDYGQFGWCGLEGLEWIWARLEIEHIPLQEEIDATWMKLQCVVEPKEMDRYLRSFPLEEHKTFPLRVDFMRMLMEDPTQPIVHGFGIEGERKPPQNLKLIGRVAAVLISKGHPSKEATEIAEHAVQFQDSQLKSVMHAKDQIAYHTILEHCVRHNIPVHQMTKSQAVSKLQSFWRSKWSKQSTRLPTKVDPNQIQWIAKTFMVRNGQYVDPQNSWSPMTRGLAISTPSELEPYLAKGKLLSSEVNTALTCEKVSAVDPIQVQQVEIMVRDAHGNHALIQAWLTSFGPTPVIVAPKKNADVEVDSLSTLSFTVHQCHVDEFWWKDLLMHPARFLLQQTFKDEEIPKFAKIWSRRWMLGGRNSESQLADSFSLLGSVNADAVDAILAKSGTQRPPIFISPLPNKNAEDNQKWNGMRVVWMGREIEGALLAIGPIKDHCGLVFKPPSYGIRVPEGRFQEIYREIKQEDPPSVVKCTFSNGKFIVGAASHPAATQFAINSVPIIHSWIKEIPKETKPILAGKLVMQHETGSESKGTDTLQSQDPWGSASLPQPNKSQFSGQASWAQYRPVTTSYGPYRGPPTVSTTTAADESMKGQSDRINSIEADLASIKSHMEATQQSNENRFNRLQNDMQTMQTSMRSTLEAALSDQSSQLIRTFEQLMKGSPKATPRAEEGARSRSPTR
eukprot:Skav220667  [mRNA]  locus=scaffold1914:52437:57580:+ [translate_table: standard]